jgi:hypothetical protein
VNGRAWRLRMTLTLAAYGVLLAVAYWRMCTP